MRLAEEALTFDDVLLQPAYSDVLPRDVSLATQLTRGIALNIPVISAAMDTVTEARFAISLAQEGGIGIVHKNMTPDQQAQHVRMVKKFESGVIREPITVGPNATIRDVLNLTAAHDISGVPVVDGEELAGIVTSRDLRFETRFDAPVSAVMTPKDKLVTVGESAGRDEFVDVTRDVWRIDAESAKRVGHPAPFPVELPRRLIDLYTYRDDIVEAKEQIFQAGWFLDYPDPVNFLQLFWGDNAGVHEEFNNTARYDSPDFNKVYEQLQAMQPADENRAKRKELVGALAQELAKDQPTIPLFHERNTILRRTDIKWPSMPRQTFNDLRFAGKQE